MNKNQMNYYSDKQILVLGLAKSGTSVAKLLSRLGANVTVNDAKQEGECKEKNELEKLGIKVVCGGHPESLFDQHVDLVVKNPGIPYTIWPIQKAISLGIPVITEVEIAYQITQRPMIGITGSNGKTTTTTLIGEILKEANLNPIVAGNIGTVLSEQAEIAHSNEVLVAELSSFQLKGTIYFKPSIAILLNIYPSHLDYHQTMEDYIESKSKIFLRQTSEDYSVINADCDLCMNLKSNIKSQTYFFSTKGLVERGAMIKDKTIVWKEDNHVEEVIDIREIFLRGEHNLENILAAIVATKLYGAHFKDIKKVLKSFRGVEHRQEYVRKTDKGIIFYNDSKATNPTATINALKSFDEPIILIAGGLDRGIDFLDLVEPFKKHVKALITYGQSAEKIKKIGQLVGLQMNFTVDNVNTAVIEAERIASREDIVLLSPACASWDMFASFEERGRIFKEAVHRL